MTGARLGVIVASALLLGAGAFGGYRLARDDGGDAAVAPGAPRVSDPGISIPDQRVPDQITTTSSAAALTPVSAVRVKTTPVARVSKPVDLATRPGDDALYVAEQGGKVMAIRGTAAETVLDLGADVSSGYEQGLLGIEFSPDGSFLYANFTDRQGDSHVVEWTVRDENVDAGSRREVISYGQPFANHNGGALEFGPDGFLYVSTGDGGSGGDPQGNGQRLDTLLGKILRIHPRPTGNSPYAVPSTNPFLETPGARGEIWAYGLRNPWRIAFDRQSGDLWIADVGQGDREEIDFQPGGSKGGENYGWNRFEGARPFQGSPPAQHVLPVHDYANGGGNCAVTGGHVYRGDRIPALHGVYVFADFCAGDLMGLRQAGGTALDVGSLGVKVDQVSAFGLDQAGEMYVLSLAGAVLRIDPA